MVCPSSVPVAASLTPIINFVTASLAAARAARLQAVGVAERAALDFWVWWWQTLEADLDEAVRQILNTECFCGGC